LPAKLYCNHKPPFIHTGNDSSSLLLPAEQTDR